jgi:N-acetylneuraminic acid mutarotase
MLLRDCLRFWLRSLARSRHVPMRRPALRRLRSSVESLEDRCLPATLTLNPVTLAGPVSAGLYSGPVDTFTETGRTGVQASDFQALIDWGDHTPLSVGMVQTQNDGSFEVLGSHTYHEGIALPTVAVTDEVAHITSRALSASWSTAASMPTPRAGLAAVAGPHGRIYAFGGENISGYLNTVEVYDATDNTWSTAAPMPTPRHFLAAAAGPDGRIYAFGGENISGYLNTVEVYNPTANTWSTAAPMPTARFALAAVAGPDGRIFVLGGNSGGDFLDTVGVYDPVANAWSTAAPMPTAREGLAAVAGPDGRIFVFGGANSSGDLLDTVEVYNPTTNNWSTAAPMPTARDGLAAVAGPDGRIFVFGGASRSAVVNTVEVYDPTANTWSTAAPMPTTRFALAAVAGPDGRTYILGGFQSSTSTALQNTVDTLSIQPVHVLHGSLTAGTINIALTEEAPFNGAVVHFESTNTLEKATDFTAVIHWGDCTPDNTGTVTGGFGQFTVSGSHTYALPGNLPLTVDITDTAGVHITAAGSLRWQSAAAMPGAFQLQATTVGADGRIYVAGGFHGLDGPVSNSLFAYDTTTASWSTLADMPTARFGLAAATGSDGRVYAIGGYNNGVLNTVEAYDPVSDTWFSAAPLPTAAFYVSAVAGQGGRIYVFGGQDASGNALNTLQVYDPATNTWSSGQPMPTARFGLATVVAPDGRIYAIGGSDTNGNVLTTVEVYDPAANSWSSVASIPTAREWLAAAVGPDGLIYATGGYNSGALNTVEIYNPISNSWATGASLPTAVFGLTVALGPDGLLYTMGGYTSLSSVASVNVLNPSTQVAALPASRLVLTGFPSAVAGTPETFTVSAEDAYGNIVTGYSGTVSFSASGVAKLPAPAQLTNGSGSFTATLFSAGLQSLSVSDGTLSGQENDIIITPASPDTTSLNAPLTVSPSTPSFGQLVSVTAKVNDTSAAATATPDGGFVIFSDNGRQIGVALLSNGSATINTTFTGGSQFLSATYTGNSNFLGSGTATLTTLNVTRLPTSVALSTTPANSVQAGQSVTLSAQVSGPAGIVTFYDGSTALGAVVVDVGASVVTCTVPSLAFGTRTLSATFSPADILDYAPSSSSLPFTVTAAAPANIVAASGSGQSVPTGSAFAASLVATVSDQFGNPVAGVSVTFSAPASGASAGFLGSSTVTTNPQGQASVAVEANSKGGIYNVLASLPGLTAASFSLTNLFATTTTLKANTSHLVFGQSVLLTSTVTVPAGMGRTTGSVTFFEDGDPVGTVSLVKGSARLLVSNLDVGSDSFTASYNGNAIYAASSSSSLTTNMTQAATRTKLTTSSATPQFGDMVTLTASLWAVARGSGIPSGTVTFMDGSTLLGTATLDDGAASFSTSALALGGHAITAVYGGDDNFLASTSAALNETVVQAQVNVQLSASPTSASQGTPITFSVAVVPVNGGTTAPTGAITLFDGSRALGTVTLSGGSATLTISNLKNGTRSITAFYSGDSDFLSAISAALSVTIG